MFYPGPLNFLSRISKFFIPDPDPGGKKAPDPGSKDPTVTKKRDEK
jgi:hypothetical protein